MKDRVGLSDLRQRWQQAPRHWRWAVTAGVALLATTLLWQLVWLPSWRTLRQAPAQQQQLLHDIRELRSHAAALAALRDAPSAKPGNADPSATTEQLRAASLQWLGGSVRVGTSPRGWEVTVEEAPADGLAQWLVRVRQPLGLRIERMQLQRSASAGTWQGTISLTSGETLP